MDYVHHQLVFRLQNHHRYILKTLELYILKTLELSPPAAQNLDHILLFKDDHMVSNSYPQQ